MTKDIKRLMERCDVCAQFRTKFREPATLKPSFKGKCPWECISIDLTGDMNSTEVETNQLNNQDADRLERLKNKAVKGNITK